MSSKTSPATATVPVERTFVLLFVILSLSLFFKFWADKHLSLDGVNYFFNVLENKGFANIAWSRRFTEYLTEWPLVLAVTLDFTDLDLLMDVFALGIYFPYLVSFLLCVYAVKGENKSLLWFPLAGYLGFNTLSDYDMIADHHVLAVMTWPILLMLMRTQPLKWLEGVILWCMLAAYTRMYETAVLTAGIFLFIAFARLYVFRSSRERFIIGVAVVLLGIVAFIAIQYIIDPRSPQNLGAFLDSIWVNRRNWEAVTTSTFLALLGVAWLISDARKNLKTLWSVFALIPIGVYAYMRMSHPEYAITAHLSFSSRTLIGLVIPGLMLVCILVVLGRRKLTATGINVFVIGFFVMTLFNLYDLRHWTAVRAEFWKAAASSEMFLPIDQTPLGDGNLELRHHRWSWNNPLLSLIWAGGCVRTIVLNNPHGPQGPFDPRDRLVLKRYLKYDASFQAVDPTVTTCVNTD